MASNIFDAKPKPTNPAEKGLLIGETDKNVFNCPSCARALSEGTSVCPGCGAHLIMGVLLRRAGLILTLGMVIGMLVGGGLMASVITLSLRDSADRAAAAAGAAAATPNPEPSVSPTPVAYGYTDVGIPGAPAGAVTALAGTAVVNGRIAADTETLVATLARADATTIEIARALRSLAADAALGRDLTARMTNWNAAHDVVAGLESFYVAIGDTARTGLRFALSDIDSYRTTAETMVAVLTDLGSVDAGARDFAATLDVELPPVAAGVPTATTPSATMPGATAPAETRGTSGP